LTILLFRRIPLPCGSGSRPSLSAAFPPPSCQISVEILLPILFILLEIRGFGFQSATSCRLLPAASAIPPHPCDASFFARLSPCENSRIATFQIPNSSSFQ